MSEIQDIRSKIHQLKVLLVDDEEGVLTATGDFLKKFFDSVDLAINGKDAYQKIVENGPYDVLITDLQMPVMNGMELLDAIKHDALELFIVILSGNIDDENKFSQLCNVYLTKPTSFESMIAMLKGVIDFKRL